MFWLSRTRPMGLVVRVTFGHLTGLLPVRRVAETATVIAFEHPAPAWSPHLLLVPKRRIASFREIRPEAASLIGDVVRLAFQIAERHDLYANGFALLVNGGTYQDVRQVHFHLAEYDAGLAYATPAARPERILFRTPELDAYEHLQGARKIHVVIAPTEAVAWSDLAGPSGAMIGKALVRAGQGALARLGLGPAGFTILASVPPGGRRGAVCFHLVAGGRRPGR